MRAELLKETLKALYGIRRTVLIVGPPGGGKTTIVREVADELDLPIITRNPALTPVEDFGAPDMLAEGKSFGYKMPDWFPYQGKAGTERGGILLFDDRTQAGPDHQKAIAHLCQARDLHGVPLADGWQVVSTGNRQADRAGAVRTLSHLANRETTLEFETDLNDSTKWMIDHGVKPEVVSFIRFRPGLLHDFDP
ncbi:MAG TPA: AAA family ATPase, partial [Burkholderiaceae bacterium]|nr:AAA family ATPase [Burkholderiaceae bacterium]